jgi:hypothetical protein
MSLPPPTDIPQQLALASTAWKKLRRLAAYAAFDGWSLITLGTLTLICGGYGSVTGLLISVALLGTGLFEIRSVRALRRLNPSAISHLACNQLVLAAALILYSAISLIQTRQGGGMPSEIEQALSQAGSTADIHAQLSSAADIFYSLLIAIAILLQGSTALYYFSRQKHLQNYLAQTPDWVQQMQREGGEVSL